jgi:DNA-binding MarR family transcriptional regulator
VGGVQVPAEGTLVAASGCWLMKFYKLPIDIALRRDLPASAKIIAAVLIDRVGDNTDCWPGLRRLAADTGLSKPAVIGGLQRLQDKGLIFIEKRGKGKSNHYKLLSESGKETLPVSKSGWSRKFTSGGKETLPEVVKKLYQNQTDPLNQTHKTLRPMPTAVGLSELLLSLILSRKPDFKKPDLQKWAVHIDRMLRLDKRTPERIEKIIRWCQVDPFWQANILSTEKLREKFDQLELKMMQTKKGRNDETRNRNKSRARIAEQFGPSFGEDPARPIAAKVQIMREASSRPA